MVMLKPQQKRIVTQMPPIPMQRNINLKKLTTKAIVLLMLSSQR
jgi:hypothetical protein